MNLEEFERAFGLFDETVRNSEMLTAIRKELETRQRLAPGREAPAFTLARADGQEMSLVDLRGQVVLLDFWASWCGMCIHSMPEVKKLAEEYSGQLEVIAVSWDKKQEAWRKAMERIKFPFPHYVMTEKGFNDFYYNKYQVRNGVPYYMLVAPDGTVLCAPHSVSQVRQILAEVLK